NSSYNYTYERKEEHWFDTRRLAENYISVNKSMPKRIYDYIAKVITDLRKLKFLKEKQENDKISDPKIPLLYRDNEKRDFNLTIHNSLQTKTKTYQEYCQEMQDKTNRQKILSNGINTLQIESRKSTTLTTCRSRTFYRINKILRIKKNVLMNSKKAHSVIKRAYQKIKKLQEARLSTEQKAFEEAMQRG
ncbi:12392_t:CDS:2, partial [Cetraspora pellucida]